MRRIGTLADPEQAKRFSDYLLTQSVQCRVDTNPSKDPSSDATADGDDGQAVSCDLWIRDEADVQKGKAELDAFLAAPEDPKYNVGVKAKQLRKQTAEEEKRKRKLQKAAKPPSRGSGILMGVPLRQQAIPVVIGVIALSILASFSTGFGYPKPSNVPGELSSEEAVFYGLSFVDWRDYVTSGNDPFASIKKGEVWRLVTPIFLHGSTFHLAFNMLGLFFLGSAIERLQGSWFMAFLLLASGIVGGLVQVWLPPADELPSLLHGLAGTPFSIGASGAVYGLFGYLWIRPLLAPSYPVRMLPNNVAIMMGFLVFCIFFVDRIANGAHIGGLLAGVVTAAAVSQMNLDSFS